MIENGPMNRKPGRRYQRVGRTIRRVKTPPPAPIPCVIVDTLENTHVTYDSETHKLANNPGTLTVFPSRSQAEKALWHITQELKALNLTAEFTRYKIEPWGGS